MFDLEKYSPENLERIRTVIKIVLDELELQEINKFAGNKILLKLFEKRGFSYSEVITILNKIISSQDKLFKIGNEEIKKQIENNARLNYIFNPNKEAVKQILRRELLERLHITENDLRDYIFLRLDSVDSQSKLKELLKSVTSQLPQSNKTSDLVAVLPSGKKYSIPKRMLKRFQQKNSISNYLLASCIIPTLLNSKNQRQKFRKADYNRNKKMYDKKIKNCFITIRKFLNPSGYNVIFHSQLSELTRRKE